jgi:hypothetical protein
MLKLAYVGIVFSLVFYIAFGLAVRFMELSHKARNKARLIILVASMIFFSISGTTAGILKLRTGSYLYGATLLVLSVAAIVFVLSIFVELHQINTRVRMRRFMVLFDIVDRFINEGKSHEEILEYLTGIQKLTVKEASDFLEFISDPNNHQFLADVNDKIQEAKMLQKAEQDCFR